MLISLFSQSLAAMIAGESLVLLFVMTRLYDGASAFSVILLFLFGSLISFIGANLYAVALHHRLLLLLYSLQKPKDFIRLYEPLLRKHSLPSNVRFTLCAYLSNGYAAMGDFKHAYTLLEQSPSVGRLHAAERDRLLCGNRISLALAQGDFIQAHTLCDALERSIQQGRLSKKKRKNQLALLRTLRVQTAAIRGTCTHEDCVFLCQQAKKARSALKRTELSYAAGLAYLALNDAGNARPYLVLAAQSKQDMHYGMLAAKALSSLSINSPSASKKKKQC